MVDDVHALKLELETWKANYKSLAERTRELDMADVAARAVKPKDDFMLRYAQQSVAENLSNPDALEEHRAVAWSNHFSSIGQGWRSRPPKDGTWPPDMPPDKYVRGFHGLNERGTALIGQAEPEPEPTAPLSPWLEEGVARAKGGRP